VRRTWWIAAAIFTLGLWTCQQTQTPSEFGFDEAEERSPDTGRAGPTRTETAEDTEKGNERAAEGKADPEPIEWDIDPDEPAEVHPKADRHEAGTFDWAPEDREVLLHTYAESEATQSAWEQLIKPLYEDDGNESVGERIAFGLVVDAPLYEHVYRNDLTLADRYGEVGGELEPGETVYWGLAGPFARHRIHLFECGPTDGEEGPTRAWRVGEFVVRCNYPNLRYGVALDADVERSTEESEMVVAKHNCDRARKQDVSSYELQVNIVNFSPEPAVPQVYLDWWREVREADRRAWKSMPEHRLSFDERKFARMDAFIFDGSRGTRSPRLTYTDFYPSGRMSAAASSPEVQRKCRREEKLQILRKKCGVVRNDCIGASPGPKIMNVPIEYPFIFPRLRK